MAAQTNGRPRELGQPNGYMNGSIHKAPVRPKVESRNFVTRLISNSAKYVIIPYVPLILPEDFR